MATRFAGDSPLLLAASPDQHEGEIEIENPDLSSFVFLRDDSVLDLRPRAETKTPYVRALWNAGTGTHAATYMNTMTVRKTKQATVLPLVYSTSGTLAVRDALLHGAAGEAEGEERAEDDDHGTAGGCADGEGWRSVHYDGGSGVRRRIR